MRIVLQSLVLTLVVTGSAGAGLFGFGADSTLDSLYGSASDLERAAKRYDKIVREGGWPRIDSGAVLEVGDSDPRVPDIRKVLVATEDLEKRARPDRVDRPERYDEQVAKAVERFQRRHHLLVDGKVGPETIAALNVTAEERLSQIEAALETRRELDERFDSTEADDRAILINLPEYRLHLLEKDEPTLSMNVAIGEPGWKTPILRERLETIIVNPYWYVPIEIIAAEISPKVLEDASYLETQGLEIAKSTDDDAEIVDPGKIDWRQVSASDPDTFPYYLRHRPGPENPLGRIKFRLPNREDIYLHDTPGEHIFDESERAVSHGCIRLERPIALADRLMAEVEGWNPRELHELLDSGELKYLPLETHVPVEAFYLTAWADDDTVYFTDTPYGLRGPEQVVEDPQASSSAVGQ